MFFNLQITKQRSSTAYINYAHKGANKDSTQEWGNREPPQMFQDMLETQTHKHIYQLVSNSQSIAKSWL